MSFQAYLDNIEAKTGKTPNQFIAMAKEKSYDNLVAASGAISATCASCHKADLLGESAAPPLAGPEFSQRWVGSTVDDLVTTIRRSMPQDAPDSLGTPAYVDLVSYLLSASGSPAGASDLPLESAGLKQIQFTAR